MRHTDPRSMVFLGTDDRSQAAKRKYSGCWWRATLTKKSLLLSESKSARRQTFANGWSFESHHTLCKCDHAFSGRIQSQLTKQFQSLCHVRGRDHFEALVFKRQTHHRAKGVVVIHKEDPVRS